MSAAAVVLAGLLPAALRSATPLLWTLLGETVTQRAGIINLGVEGQMLVGAATAFGVTVRTGSLWLGLLAAAAAGTLLSLVHAVLCVRHGANQFAAGISVWMMGFGLSAYFGAGLVGQSVPAFAPLATRLPIIRELTPTVLLAVLATPLFALFLYWTRFGLALRAVGESVDAARIAGLAVDRLRVLAVMIGGCASGIGGAALSIDHAQTWAEGMTRGRGLVAVGLVIVARWNPLLALPAALLFGGAEALSVRLQSAGTTFSPHLLHTLPYLACLVVFVATSLRVRAGGGAPAGLSAVLER
jgi:general nucleoside transport system permease protein